MSKKQSIVLEIQGLASESNTEIAEILRKSLIVATKLDLEDFRGWISSELHGYKDLNIPEYRKIYADIKLKNPYHGLIPVTFQDKGLAERLRKVYICQPIGEVESLRDEPDEGDYIVIPFSHEEERFLLENQGRTQIPPVRIIYRTQVVGILDAVRNLILEWSLRLESEGILGEGMSFSKEDKQKADTPNVHIENFQGIYGNVTQSHVTQEMSMKVKKGDMESLLKYLNSIGISTEDTTELEGAIVAEPIPTSREKFGHKVSQWMGKMLTKAASGGWEVGIGTAGNMLAEALMHYYGL